MRGEAVGLIRSMLSFEKSIAKDDHEMGHEAEENFFFVMDEAPMATLRALWGLGPKMGAELPHARVRVRPPPPPRRSLGVSVSCRSSV